jgi:hypothetical protein
MLGLLGGGKIVVDLGRVNRGLNIGHLIDFLLGNNPAGMQVTTTFAATAGPATASAATATSLIKDQNGAALGNNVILLGALEVGVCVNLSSG